MGAPQLWSLGASQLPPQESHPYGEVSLCITVCISQFLHKLLQSLEPISGLLSSMKPHAIPKHLINSSRCLSSQLDHACQNPFAFHGEPRFLSVTLENSPSPGLSLQKGPGLHLGRDLGVGASTCSEAIVSVNNVVFHLLLSFSYRTFHLNTQGHENPP